MRITRRGFLGGIVASATMAEAGALAELLNWLRRKPVSGVASTNSRGRLSASDFGEYSPYGVLSVVTDRAALFPHSV